MCAATAPFFYSSAQLVTAAALPTCVAAHLAPAGILGRGAQASSDRASALRRITAARSVSDAVADCRLVIEAVVDDVGIKAGVYEDAVNSVRSDAVLATTSMNIPLPQVQVGARCLAAASPQTNP